MTLKDLAEQCLRIANVGNDDDGDCPFEGMDDQEVALHFAPLARFYLQSLHELTKPTTSAYPTLSGNSEGI